LDSQQMLQGYKQLCRMARVSSGQHGADIVYDHLANLFPATATG
jgi:hypothetical protein